MPLQPGAEPYAADGGPVGAVVIHGFTGSPFSVRPWAECLAAAGLSVRLPRLPGHGTSWQELNRTRWEDWYAEVERAFDDLENRCEQVFVLGLSMGGALGLKLAEDRGEDVAGLVLVNPSLLSQNRTLRLVPALRFVVPSLKGITDDIKRPGVTERGYDRMPLHALHSLTRLWALVGRDLGKVTQPILVFRSVEDHVVEPASCEMLRASVASRVVEERELPNSYHVATLDNDADMIFAQTLAFVRAQAPSLFAGS